MVLSPRKRKHSTSQNNEEHQEVCKVSKGMKSIRKELIGDNALKVLKDLLEQNKSQDVFSEYVDAGGNLDEIFNILNNTEDNKDVSIIVPVFDAAYHVILVYHTKLVYLMETVEQSCLRLIRSKPVVVNKMLEACSPANCKKITLRLLTAMVTVSPTLGREILASLNLKSHLVDQLARPQKEGYENSVRIAYIRFIMSFFVDNDVILIKQVLQDRCDLTQELHICDRIPIKIIKIRCEKCGTILEESMWRANEVNIPDNFGHEEIWCNICGPSRLNTEYKFDFMDMINI